MAKSKILLNNDVTHFLDSMNHPLRKEIEHLRRIITASVIGFTENIKWNGPNYSMQDDDRITMRIQPPKQIQLIFHRGAKKRVQPKQKLIDDTSGLLIWKENDRAIATFKTKADIEKSESALAQIVKDWIRAAQ
jgi:hypothetical protein